jgi:hypothetical protein
MQAFSDSPMSRGISKTKIIGFIQELIRAGRGTRYSDAQINISLMEVNRHPIRSDDPHILALALASGARLLFSRDLALRASCNIFRKLCKIERAYLESTRRFSSPVLEDIMLSLIDNFSIVSI